ncbi:hypothetical protein DMA15_06145 [Streptomyces sp. WAC 01529]|nr:hypothetical protein DMA15_06145 [Streptomyces sp. WAC 01529]
MEDENVRQTAATGELVARAVAGWLRPVTFMDPKVTRSDLQGTRLSEAAHQARCIKVQLCV